MNENQTTQLVCIAAIAGAFGVRGEIKLKAFTDDPIACTSYGPLLDETGQVVLTPAKGRVQKNMVITRAPEVKSREQAESLKSTKLYVSRDALPVPDEDEFYYTDLIGLNVIDTDGTDQGRIKAIHDFGSGNVLEIQTPGTKNWFHPFTKEAVPHINISKRQVIIEIVEAEVADEPEEN